MGVSGKPLEIVVNFTTEYDTTEANVDPGWIYTHIQPLTLDALADHSEKCISVCVFKHLTLSCYDIKSLDTSAINSILKMK